MAQESISCQEEIGVKLSLDSSSSQVSGIIKSLMEPFSLARPQFPFLESHLYIYIYSYSTFFQKSFAGEKEKKGKEVPYKVKGVQKHAGTYERPAVLHSSCLQHWLVTLVVTDTTTSTC